MNGFDVQAVGWLVTRDLCCHAAGALLGLKTGITSRRADEELFRRWEGLIDAVDQDLADQDFVARVLAPRRTPLSKRSEAAMRAFFERLVASYPERYGAQGLRSRCVIGFVLTAASFLCCGSFGHYASPETPTLGQAGLASFLVGLWYFATTLQLFRTYRLMRVLGDARPTAYERRQPQLSAPSNADEPRAQPSERRPTQDQVQRREETGNRRQHD